MANRNIRFPVGAMVDSTGFVTLEWSLWLQSPEFLEIITGIPLPVDSGGTGLTSGNSGGILGFTDSDTLASSVELTQNHIVLGGGAGFTPSPLGSLGTTTTLLHGNAAGAPTFGSVVEGDIANNAVTTAKILNAAVTYAKIQNVTDARLLGRSSGSDGSPMEITVGSGLSLSAGSLTATATGSTTILETQVFGS